MRIIDRLKALFARGKAERPATEEQLRVLPQLALRPTPQEQRYLFDDTIAVIRNFLAEVLLGSGWYIETNEPRFLELAQRTFSAFGFENLLRSCIDAQFTRFTAAEIVWGNDYIPKAYRVLPPSAIELKTDAYGEIEEVAVYTSAGRQVLPRNRLFLYRYRPALDTPMGSTRMDSLLEIYEAKRRVDEALVRFVERYAMPPLIAYHPPNASTETIDRIEQTLRAIRSGASVILPGPKENLPIEALEVGTREASPISFALELLENYERRLARAVLGSVLPFFESQYGTRAQASVHLHVTGQIVRGMQMDIEQAVNQQIWQPVCFYQFGDENPPRWHLQEPFLPSVDIARTVSELIAAGVIDPVADRAFIRQLFDLPAETNEP
jgi:phage gp29-like protein